jgi:peroxiredoxin
MLKKTILILSLSLISFLIGAIFWRQEVQYQLPTPVPANYSPVAIGDKVDLGLCFSSSENKPVLIHFFNPDCPCSKFNINHFNELLSKYKTKIDFYVVVKSDQENMDVNEIKEKFSHDVKVLNDSDNTIANTCGVYATPQAVVINKDKILFYRGNYNKSRYCTSKESNYVDISIDSLLNNKKYPVFDKLASIPYGCEIPQKQ